MTIVVAGDVMLARNVAPHLETVTRDLRQMRAAIGGDYWFANLESPVCECPVLIPGGFRANPSMSRAVLQSFDLLSVANNHATDCGQKGLAETIENLRASGVAVVGYRDRSSAQQGAILTTDGVKVGILGYVDQHTLPARAPDLLATTEDLELVKEEIGELRRRADKVICLLHAGDEMVRFPMPRERYLPIQLALAGADLVVRSHAHVVQGIGRFGRATILYGLGDCVFDSGVRRRMNAILARAEFSGGDTVLEAVHIQRTRDLRLMIMQHQSGWPILPERGLEIRRYLDTTLYYLDRTRDVMSSEGLNGFRHMWRRLRRAI